MEIKLYYEDKNNKTVLNVPEDECVVMVENDYRQRLAIADDKTIVKRRTVQEISDEEINKPTFNRNQTETRRHTSLAALVAIEKEGKFVTDNLEMFDEELFDLRRAVDNLPPKQRDLLRKIFWEGAKAKDIADIDGVGATAISMRVKRLCEELKIILAK